MNLAGLVDRRPYHATLYIAPKLLAVSHPASSAPVNLSLSYLRRGSLASSSPFSFTAFPWSASRSRSNFLFADEFTGSPHHVPLSFTAVGLSDGGSAPGDDFAAVDLKLYLVDFESRTVFAQIDQDGRVACLACSSPVMCGCYGESHETQRSLFDAYFGVSEEALMSLGSVYGSRLRSGRETAWIGVLRVGGTSWVEQSATSEAGRFRGRFERALRATLPATPEVSGLDAMAAVVGRGVIGSPMTPLLRSSELKPEIDVVKELEAETERVAASAEASGSSKGKCEIRFMISGPDAGQVGARVGSPTTSEESRPDALVGVGSIGVGDPPKGRHVCSVCSSAFGRAADLSRHVRTVHEKKRNFQCPVCDLRFLQKTHCTAHIKAVHEKSKPFSCETCSGSFTRKASLKKHIMSVHQKARPHQCQICFRYFGQRTDLNRHRRNMHTSGLGLDMSGGVFLSAT